MTQTTSSSDNQPDVQPSAPQRQEGDATGDSEQAVSPVQSSPDADGDGQPSFHPWPLEQAVERLWDHAGLGRNFVMDEDQPMGSDASST